jgi:hypothetical protein
MRIGFTGTHHGMTPAQVRVFRSILSGHKGAALHHGDCVGADAQAHEVACSLGRDVTIHPPVIGAQRAWKTSPDIRAPRPYLSRSKDIVRETDMLIAAPAEAKEQRRSGTWSTVRFARKLGKPVFVISPDGMVR